MAQNGAATATITLLPGVGRLHVPAESASRNICPVSCDGMRFDVFYEKDYKYALLGSWISPISKECQLNPPSHHISPDLWVLRISHAAFSVVRLQPRKQNLRTLQGESCIQSGQLYRLQRLGQMLKQNQHSSKMKREVSVYTLHNFMLLAIIWRWRLSIIDPEFTTLSG